MVALTAPSGRRYNDEGDNYDDRPRRRRPRRPWPTESRDPGEDEGDRPRRRCRDFDDD